MSFCLLLFLQEDAEVIVAFNVVRQAGDGLPQGVQGLTGLAEEFVGDAEGFPGEAVVGVGFGEGVRVRDHVGNATGGEQDQQGFQLLAGGGGDMGKSALVGRQSDCQLRLLCLMFARFRLTPRPSAWSHLAAAANHSFDLIDEASRTQRLPLIQRQTNIRQRLMVEFAAKQGTIRCLTFFCVAIQTEINVMGCQ